MAFECFTDPDVPEEAPYRHTLLAHLRLVRSLPETFNAPEEAVAAFRPLAPYAAEDELRQWTRWPQAGAQWSLDVALRPDFSCPRQHTATPECGSGCPGPAPGGRTVPDAASSRSGVVDGGANTAHADAQSAGAQGHRPPGWALGAAGQPTCLTLGREPIPQRGTLTRVPGVAGLARSRSAAASASAIAGFSNSSSQP